MEEVLPLPPAPFRTGEISTKVHKINKKGPIIIDNGSYKCKAGGIEDDFPSLEFHNESRRPRKTENIPYGANIGWNISEEAWRFPARSPFDHGLLSNMDCQEDVLDYIFYSFGFTGQSRISSPVAFSECLCNPNYCRNLVSELLFECYNVPSIGYYIDSLASFRYNSLKRQEISQKDGLIVSTGHSSTVVIPYLDGKTIFNAAKRIDIGGSHINSFSQSLLKLKYPEHKNYITPWFTEYIINNHTYTAKEYSSELYSYYPGVTAEPDSRIVTIQLPVPAKTVAPVLSQEEIEKKKQDRIAHGKRLKELADKRRAEKLEEHKEQKMEMQKILDKNLEPIEFEETVQELGYTDVKDFHNEFKKISKIIEKAENRMDVDDKQPIQPKTQGEEELSEDDIKRMNNFDEWVADIKERQEELLHDIEQRQRMRTSWSNRRSAESDKKLHLLNVAADTKTDESEFDDWDVYITMQTDKLKEADEKDRQELQQLTEQLQKYAPTELEKEIPIEEYYQIKLGPERVRIPEILFQPSMIGEDQMGLSEVIKSVLERFSPDNQTKLVNNIFLTGGSSKFPNFIERLKIDVTKIRPAGSSFNIYQALDPIHDAWRGAKEWSVDKEALSSFLSKAEFEENGIGYINEHNLSNTYIPTPE